MSPKPPTVLMLGILAAVPVGFMLGWYRSARTFADPMINFFRALPPIALIPLVIVYFGVDEIAAAILVVGLIAFGVPANTLLFGAFVLVCSKGTAFGPNTIV